MLQVAASGLVLGILGSLHCVGMCGPLALALPISQLSIVKRLLAILLYNGGRTFTYTFSGALFGLIGTRLYLSGMQQWVSIVMGMIILLFLILNFITHSFARSAFIHQLYAFIQQSIVRILRSPRGFSSYFWLGLLNGMLPCGMVYVALATALTFTTVASTIMFMGMFAVGTLPSMFAVSFIGISIKRGLRNTFRNVLPYSMALVAFLLILRGLHLGIPFVSPSLPQDPGEAITCHP